MDTIQQIFDLTGKCAVVTGAAKGMGCGSALRLGEAGAFVIAADIDVEGAKATAAQIQAAGGKAEALKLDLTNIADAEAFTEQVVKKAGGYDILVNVAGIYPAQPALAIDEASWDKVLNTNLKGLYFYTKAAAQVMIQAGKGGKIINIVSASYIHPTWFQAHYASSKGGLWSLTKSLALELGSQHITVNGIAPGPVMTPGLKDLLNGYAKSGGGTTVDQIVQGTASRMPLGRFGGPDDIAKVVLFLASSASDFMTGETILVDGGQILI